LCLAEPLLQHIEDFQPSVTTVFAAIKANVI